jgi:hypothetical protein
VGSKRPKKVGKGKKLFRKDRNSIVKIKEAVVTVNFN